jgi:DNA-binding transcriptional ArsR family regulator
MSRPFSAENVFRALGHKARRRVLVLLQSRDRVVAELLQGGDISAGTLSDHLRVLRQCGLVSCRRKGTHLMYHLNLPVLRRATVWLNAFERRSKPTAAKSM